MSDALYEMVVFYASKTESASDLRKNDDIGSINMVGCWWGSLDQLLVRASWDESNSIFCF